MGTSSKTLQIIPQNGNNLKGVGSMREREIMEDKKKTGKSKKPVPEISRKNPPEAEKKPAPKRKPQGNTVFALDIGTNSVVGILAEKSGSAYRILDMETVQHSKRSMRDGQIEDIAAVAEVIKRVKARLEKRSGIELSKVCIAAAGRTLKTVRATWEHALPPEKTLTAKDAKTAELEAVRRTSDKFSEENQGDSSYCVGHSVVSIMLDGYKIATPVGHRGELLTTEIIAAFLPAFVVESLCSAIDRAGLTAAGLTLEPIAAMNVIVPPDLRLINIALCDIGAGTSDVAVSRDGSVVAYGMATVAGDEVTEGLMKRLLVDFQTAERIKSCTEGQITYTNILLEEHTITDKELTELLSPSAEALAETIAAEILKANLVPPQAVFLVGGGSKLRGLSEKLAEKLELEPRFVTVGRRELMRGIIAPDNLEIGAEHATPLGIAITNSEGLSYDFTTITLNGNKIRALGTSRLTIFELLPLGDVSPETLTAKAGEDLTFTLNGERVTLRGTPAKPAEIIIDGKAASLESTVGGGDDVEFTPAENGADASARLSDYIEIPVVSSITVTLLGDEWSLKRRIFVNGRAVSSDREIHNGDEILEHSVTLGELLNSAKVTGRVLLNGKQQSRETVLCDGDVIEEASSASIKMLQPESDAPPAAAEKQAPLNPPKAGNAPEDEPPVKSEPTVQPEQSAQPTQIAQPVQPTQPTQPAQPFQSAQPVQPVQNAQPDLTEQPKEIEGISISFNGMDCTLPLPEDGHQPIFLDITSAFSDDPTTLLAHSNIITINGKFARLDEEIHDGDVIVIE